MAMPESLSHDRDDDRERHRDVEAVCETHKHIAAAVVGAHEMRAGWRIGRCAGVVEQRLVRTVGIQRHQHPVAGVLCGELLLELAVVRFADRLHTELRGRVIRRDGEEVAAVVVDDQRLAVGEQRQRERERVRDRDEQERVVPALQPSELAQALPQDGFGPAH